MRRVTTRGWLGRLLLLVAIVVMPLQGIAMAATFIQCHEQAAAAQSPVHDHSHDHDGGASHHHGSSDDGTPSGGMTASHHLCGHFVLHAPASLDLPPLPRFADWSASPAERYSVHFPDHPRRPPRG